MTPKKVQKKLSKKVNFSFIPKLRKYIPLFLLSVTIIVLIIVYPKPKSTYNPNPSPSLQASHKASSVPSPSPSPKNLKKETVRRENPDKTFAFFYSSDTPAFSGTEVGKMIDPFFITLNGDANYFTQSTANKVWGNNIPSNIFIVKPIIIDLKTNAKHELSSVDKGFIQGNGYTQIPRWVNNTTLFAKSCGEVVGCSLDLIDVNTNTLTNYADIKSAPLDGYTGYELVNHIGHYFFVQTIEDQLPVSEIKIYQDNVSTIQLLNTGRYDFTSLVPMSTLKTSKYMQEIILDDTNAASLNQKIIIHLSQQRVYGQNVVLDGYFVFDLQSGTVIEEHNL